MAKKEKAPKKKRLTKVEKEAAREVKAEKRAEAKRTRVASTPKQQAKIDAQDKKEKAKYEARLKKAADKEAKRASSGKKKKLKTYQQRQNRTGYAFMAPWIIGFLVFTAFPFIMTIYLSFTNVKSTIFGYDIKWNGVSNYYTAFFKNEKFLAALLSYLQMIIPYAFIVVVLSFIIAYLLCKINVGKGILRTIYFLPVIIMSGPVMSQILTVQSAGTAEASAEAISTNAYSNIFIMQIIESYSPGLASGLAGIFDHLSIILWFTGIPIVLFINGLQKINPSIYEAAKIDSANAWQIMWKITIPMLKSIGLIITVFTVIQLGMYDSINPVYELIEKATEDTNGGLGFAATYAWIYSFVALIIIGIVFLLFRDRKPKDIKARQKQEKKLKKLEKQQKRRLAAQKRHQKKEAKLYGK